MNNEWGIEQSCRTLKTPTCLLLKPDKSFDSFGYEAVEKYANEIEVEEQKNYYFFERFKMKLHVDEVTSPKLLSFVHDCANYNMSEVSNLESYSSLFYCVQYKTFILESGLIITPPILFKYHK